MQATPIIAHIFTAHEATQPFNHLVDLEFEYHKPNLRFDKPVKVPRGQASSTLDETIHYSCPVRTDNGHNPEQSPPSSMVAQRDHKMYEHAIITSSLSGSPHSQAGAPSAMAPLCTRRSPPASISLLPASWA
jgi:hypothetical protein